MNWIDCIHLGYPHASSPSLKQSLGLVCIPVGTPRSSKSLTSRISANVFPELWPCFNYFPITLPCSAFSRKFLSEIWLPLALLFLSYFLGTDCLCCLMDKKPLVMITGISFSAAGHRQEQWSWRTKHTMETRKARTSPPPPSNSSGAWKDYRSRRTPFSLCQTEAFRSKMDSNLACSPSVWGSGLVGHSECRWRLLSSWHQPDLLLLSLTLRVNKQWPTMCFCTAHHCQMFGENTIRIMFLKILKRC